MRHSICILITKLHLQVVELSKNANINSEEAIYRLIRESRKKISRKILAIETIAHPQTKKEEGHLIAGYHSQQMISSQCSGKTGIKCLHEYAVFRFLFQLHD